MNHIKVIVNQIERTLPYDPAGQGDLLSLLREAGIYLPALCGGKGTCGKCRVRVIEGEVVATEADKSAFSPSELAEGYRLACGVKTLPNLVIQVPDSGEQAFAAIHDFENGQADGRAPVSGTAVSAGSGQGGWGVAVDIGTTTIGFALVALATGEVARRSSVVNRQRQFGADVISRIQSANDGKLADMRDCVRHQLAEQIRLLTEQENLKPADVVKVTIAANTTMIHILLGYSCGSLGHAPFTPVTLDAVTLPWGELFDGPFSCPVTVLPGISTYVGADIAAGIHFMGLEKEREPVVLMDIGTNGEIVLAAEGRLVCAATAAGPAFEGGNILWGTGSVPGAISAVRASGRGLAVETIGGESPIGICGSGVVDAVAVGLEKGFIRRSGKFDREQGLSQLKLARTAGGEDIALTLKDVRELQLAKSAIRSGLDAILRSCDVPYEAVRCCYLAGGFGYHLNVTSSIEIGLIPGEWREKTQTPGNTSLGGAVRCLLSVDSGETLKEICKKAEEWSLPGDPWFADAFIRNLRF